MTKDELTLKFIELNEKTTGYMATMTTILSEINDNNKLHKRAIDVNTEATKQLTNATKEQTKSFNKIWYIFWAVIVALIVLAGAEKALKFL